MRWEDYAGYIPSDGAEEISIISITLLQRSENHYSIPAQQVPSLNATRLFYISTLTPGLTVADYIQCQWRTT